MRVQRRTLRRRHLERTTHVAHIFTSKMNKERTSVERWADWMTDSFGSMTFLLLNALFFIAWIAINIGLIPAIAVFDPFPFGFLTMLVSLEAIVLSVVVLISQNRAAKIADLREEVDFQVNVQAERENGKMLRMLSAIERRLNIKDDDMRELRNLDRGLDLDDLERQVRKSLDA